MSENTEYIVEEKINKKLPMGQNIALAIQHAIIAIVSAIPVPLIIQSQTGISDAETVYFISSIILAIGISTVLCSIGPKKLSPKIPMVMGAAFAIIPACISVFNRPDISSQDGFRIIAGATIVSGIVMFLLSFGWAKLMPLFPTVVVGTNTMILGLYLYPNVFSWIIGDSTTPGSVPVNNFFLAFFVLIISLLLSKFLKGFLANLTVLLSLIIGTIVAFFFGMTDFSMVGQSPVFEPLIPFVKYGLPKFDVLATISFVIVGILSMVEITGTSMGLYGIINKKMDGKDLQKTLTTSGVNTMLSGAVGAVQPVPFIQNLGVLDMTQIFSRFLIGTTGIILIVLSFFPQVAAVINAIPKPVLGGASFLIFGGIIASGVNILKDTNMSDNRNKIVVGVAVGMAMLPAFFPNFYANFPQLVQDIFGNGILAGNLTAVILNLVFNFKTNKET